VPQDLHQEPRAVATRAGASRERVLRRLDSHFHPDEVADLALQALIERDQEVHGVLRLARQRGDERGEPRPRGFLLQVRREFLGELGRIGERERLGERLDEEVERVDHRHVGDEVDGDGELPGPFRKDEARLPVAVRVLQPVHEVLGRRHLERIAHDAGAAVRRRPQPDHLRPEADRTIVTVAGDVVETGENGHRYAAPLRKNCSHVTLFSMQVLGRGTGPPSRENGEGWSQFDRAFRIILA
jgi:hypothetical protein